NGIYISTKKQEQGWTVEVDTSLKVTEDVQLSHTIMYKEEEITSSKSQIHVEDKSEKLNQQSLFVADVLLWSMDEPNLYEIRTELKSENGTLIETITQNIGFRTIELDANDGFRLNGVRRSEERRVGKECRSRWNTWHEQKQTTIR